MTSLAIAAEERILKSWPTNVDAADVAALRATPVERRRRLLDKLIDTLPVGPLGATEATRIEQVITISVALEVKPSQAAVVALRARCGTQELPQSVTSQLTRLEKMAPEFDVTPGVLGGDTISGVTAPPTVDNSADATGGGAAVELDRPRPRRGNRPNSTPTTDIPTPPAPPAPPADRFFDVDIDDHSDLGQPLQAGAVYTLAFEVSHTPGRFSDTNRNRPFGPFSFPPAVPRDASPFHELSVQISSQDFEIVSESARPLQLPDEGPSRGKARFDVSPKRDGLAVLTATLSYQGNFITQTEFTCPVGEPGAFSSRTTGRTTVSAAALRPRDLGLVIRPLGNFGFLCTAMGSVSFDAIMPLSAESLHIAAADARAALSEVVMDDYNGNQCFLSAIDIPADVEERALRRLAEAGRRLYQRVFTPPEGGDDLARLGEWLGKRVGDPRLQLTVQISANRVPIPWSILYFGDVGPDDSLDWNKFLGIRHIIEQLPFQKMPDEDDPEIDSQPDLTVGLNINTALSGSAKPLVAQHQRSWSEIAASRTHLSLVTRSTRADLLAALAADSTTDKVMYFYCHAVADENNPDHSAIIMGTLADRSSYATVQDLNLHAPTKTKLAGRPLIVLNACESADLSPRFYDGFVPYFVAKGARGVIGTECRTPVLFAIEWADLFVAKLLDGARIGQALLDVRLHFLEKYHNPLGLLYTSYCDATTQIVPPVS